jgi:hypothetical protein
MTHRRGIMMLEMAVAVLLVGLLMAISIKLLGWSIRERQLVDRRATALIEAGNLLDQLTNQSWDDLTEPSLESVKLSAEATAILPNAKLAITLRQPEADPTAKQINVALVWQGGRGEQDGPVKLTAWKFKPEASDEN